jgi:hypothetical protein
MENMIDLVIGAIIGPVVGAIVTKLLENKEKNYVGEQVVLKNIIIEEKRFVKVKKTSNKSGVADDTWVVIIVFALISFFLIRGFLEYESQIITMILTATFFLESMFLAITWIGLKKCVLDDSTKRVVLFNIIAVACLPILMYFMKNPLVEKVINKESVLLEISKNGLLWIFNDASTWSFLLYQLLGIAFICIFIIFSMVGIVHVLSKINFALGYHLKKVWLYFYKKTIWISDSYKSYVGFGIFLLAISFVLISGIGSNFITHLTEWI